MHKKSLILLLLATLYGCGPRSVEPVKINARPIAATPHSLKIESPRVLPTHYQVRLRVDPNSPDFTGHVQIDVEIKTESQAFYLNANGLSVNKASLHVAGQELELQVDSQDENWILFQANKSFPSGTAKIDIQYQGKVDEESSYGVFRQKAGKDWYLFTQFESRAARRAVPSLDQPDIKVPWTLTLEVPKGLVALANTPELNRTSLDKNWDLVEFAKSKPMPSYLWAFAVGPFDMVDIGKTRYEVPVRIATPRGRGGEAVWVVESTLRLIEILEDYTGIPYPYAKLDLVSIPATGSFGAMENAGLITYSEKWVLSKSNSLAFKKGYASIAAHELAHQWFGNLVTNAWWDDIWLNESFATWAAAKTLSTFRPKWGSDLAWARRREYAMHADRLASTRVIRQKIVKEEDIGAAFDGITYAKGASILTMFEGWLGKEKFAKGIAHYLQKNSWKSVTASEFLSAMDVGTGTKISTAFTSFINNPGTPLVTFNLVCEKGKTPQLKLSQERYKPLGSEVDSLQSYQVPVCVRYPFNGSYRMEVAQACVLLDNKMGELALTKARSCPKWIIPNASGTGYYRFQLSKILMDSLWSKASFDSARETVVIAKDIQSLVFAGKESIQTLLTLVSALAKSKDEAIVATALDLASFGALVSDNDQKKYSKWISELFGSRGLRLGWSAKKNDSPAKISLRESLIGLLTLEGEHKKLVRDGKKLASRWLKNPDSVNPDMAGLALRVGARFGDSKQFDAYVEAIKKSDDRRRRQLLLLGLGQTVNSLQVQSVLKLMLDKDIDVRESSRMFIAMAEKRQTVSATLEFLDQNFDALVKRYGLGMQSRLIRVIGDQCDPKQKELVFSLLDTRFSKLPGTKSAVVKRREAYVLCLAAKEKLSLPTKW